MEDEDEFRKEVYRYCDNRVGEEVLFPVFPNLWLTSGYTPVAPKDLVSLVGGITSDLVNKGVLERLPVGGFYEMYKILPHERLTED